VIDESLAGASSLLTIYKYKAEGRRMIKTRKNFFNMISGSLISIE
jgi:hypothetical protein